MDDARTQGEGSQAEGTARDESAQESVSAQELVGKRIFTTGEAAAVCKVSQQTIIRCFDSGRLVGFRVPGSKFRRIPREELIRFMKSNGIPLDALEGERKRVLLVDDDPAILDVYMEILSRDRRIDARTAMNGYDAGLFTEQFRPHLVVLDYMLPDINGNHVCKRIRENPAYGSTRILVVSGMVQQAEVEGVLRAGADAFLKKPFAVHAFLAQVGELLELEGVAGSETSGAGAPGA